MPYVASLADYSPLVNPATSDVPTSVAAKLAHLENELNALKRCYEALRQHVMSTANPTALPVPPLSDLKMQVDEEIDELDDEGTAMVNSTTPLANELETAPANGPETIEVGGEEMRVDDEAVDGQEEMRVDDEAEVRVDDEAEVRVVEQAEVRVVEQAEVRVDHEAVDGQEEMRVDDEAEVRVDDEAVDGQKEMRADGPSQLASPAAPVDEEPVTGITTPVGSDTGIPEPSIPLAVDNTDDIDRQPSQTPTDVAMSISVASTLPGDISSTTDDSESHPFHLSCIFPPWRAMAFAELDNEYPDAQLPTLPTDATVSTTMDQETTTAIPDDTAATPIQPPSVPPSPSAVGEDKNDPVPPTDPISLPSTMPTGPDLQPPAASLMVDYPSPTGTAEE
jgi:hypothetical protein